MRSTKMRTKEDLLQKPPIPILKKSESYKAIRSNQLFENQQLKQLKQTKQVKQIKEAQMLRNTDSVRSSFQQTLKQQLRKLRKKENGGGAAEHGDRNLKEKRRSLGHQLIQQIKQLSKDDVIVTKIVVEFMESISANSDRDIVEHFKNTLNLLVKAIRGNVKGQANLKEKEIAQRKNSLKKMMISSKSLEDEFEDVSRQLKLYKDLLEEQKNKNKAYESKLSKIKKTNEQLQDKQQNLQIQIDQLKKSNYQLQDQLKDTQKQYSKIKQQMDLVEEKLHCSKIENETLHLKNKDLEREIFSLNKQLSSLKSTSDNKIQELRAESKEYKGRLEAFEDRNNELEEECKNFKKNSQDGVSKMEIEYQYLSQQLVIAETKLEETVKQLEKVEQKYEKSRRREAELDGRIQTLEYQKMKLNNQLKSLYESHESLQDNNEGILPPPSPQFQQQRPLILEKAPKSNKKLKALEDIQALIRKHKVSQ